MTNSVDNDMVPTNSHNPTKYHNNSPPSECSNDTHTTDTNTKNTITNQPGHRLDPEDWDAFGQEMHHLLDACLERMRNYRELPWQPPVPPPTVAAWNTPHPPNEQKQQQQQNQQQQQKECYETKNTSSSSVISPSVETTKLSSAPPPPPPTQPTEFSQITDHLIHSVMPTAMGNTHPSFWGWVNGAGVPACLAAELVAATMNSNCGGRHHGAPYVEQQCIQWLCHIAGFYNNQNKKNAFAASPMSGSALSTTATTMSGSSSSSNISTETEPTTDTDIESTTTPSESTSTIPTATLPTPLCTTPSTPGGVLTTGTSHATLLAFGAARRHLLGTQVMHQYGIQHQPVLRVYVSHGTHSCVGRTLHVMGHGTEETVCCIPTATSTSNIKGNRSMCATTLRACIEEDLQHEDRLPWMIVGTAGSVGTGTFDDLETLSQIAKEYNLWLHVDAAFGFWTRLSNLKDYQNLSRGMEHADSIGLDAHKWPGVTYSCGACLVANQQGLRETFSSRASYLQSDAAGGLAGGDLWYTDYTTELSRDFRALKLWTALQTCGTDALGAAITDNCQQAALMGDLVDASPYLTLEHPVVSNVCIFSVAKGNVNEIAAQLQREGQAVFSTYTTEEGVPCLRAAIVNHRTTSQDVRDAIRRVEETQMAMALAEEVEEQI